MTENNKMNFWQDHSLEYLEMALKRDFQERVNNPDGYGKRTGECGDTVEFFLMETDGVISSVSYDVDGCKNTNACANTVVHFATGRSVADAWSITHEDVSDFLKTLPSHDSHCAELAVGAFYLALRDLAGHSNQTDTEETTTDGQDVIV
ncbi:MAG: iron-sulfur cluster assembly scaffold protein [Desulfobacteraceae bacterium]|nr:iron-sulfur cluster assembly scaffold protein [Desulfobacteraceae bacterium]